MATQSQLDHSTPGETVGPQNPSADAPLPAAKPAVPSRCSEILSALRGIAALNGLTDDEYTWLIHHGTERMGVDGALIFHEGDPAVCMNIILSGEVHVRRRHSGPIALFIGRAGVLSGKLPFSRMKTYGGDGYAVGPTWALDIEEDLFPAMLAAIPSMGQRCVSILLDRVREVTRMEQQAEKLSALGKLAANLAHELNNPASAAQRSAASLFSELREYGEQKYRMGNLCLSDDQTAAYRGWVASTRDEMARYKPEVAAPQGPLDATDREETVVRWLNTHNVPDPWKIAPALAETHVALTQLDKLVSILAPEVLPLALNTIAASLRVERMTETVLDSTVRIFDLISAIKDYSYMDQAPVQDVDLAQSLSTTLIMVQSRLQGIRVESDFDPSLPPISAYGSELSQVWTVLIDNAIDALNGHGTLRLVTRLTGTMATIEVWDDGPGVAPEIQSRIFEPFFSTKPPGSGLGLGLDTAARIISRHSGFLTVESKPGCTCFKVRVPLDPAEAY